MKTFSPQYFFPVTMTLLLAGMALVLWLGILPLYQKVTTQRDEIQKFYTSRENKDRQLALLSELRHQFDGVVRDEHLLNILLTDNQMVDFIKVVEGKASESQVAITITAKEQEAAIVERKPKKPPAKEAGNSAKTKEPVKTLMDELPFDRYLPLNISVIGSYENIVLFLHKLETLPIGLDVVSMIVEPHEEDDAPSARPGGDFNPFQPVLGDPSFATTLPPGLTAEERLEATFGVLVYADQKKE